MNEEKKRERDGGADVGVCARETRERDEGLNLEVQGV
jgi:hypothetical protein